ncbi:MAG: complex I NDUFA9 subunit family protein, partial [Pseudomonadota bacterium]
VEACPGGCAFYLAGTVINRVDFIEMTQVATLFGGSGFVGRYIAGRLVARGWEVRLASRSPKQMSLSGAGSVTPVACNINDDVSVRAAMDGANAVVNCVGTFDKSGENGFRAIQNLGAARIGKIAQELSVARLVHLSAIGADPNSPTLYGQSKGQGEQAILSAFPDAVVLRPSVIFGPEDQFFNRFAAMTRFNPVLPVVGAATKFQCVYVDDVAAAVEKAVMGEAEPGIYELGGPDVKSFGELMQMMLDVLERKRQIVNIPFPMAHLMAVGMEVGQTVTFGLLPPQITQDQVKSLKSDNVVGAGMMTLETLGITPTPLADVLPGYLR